MTGGAKNLVLMAGYGAGHLLLLLPANVFWHPPAGWRFAFLAVLPVRAWPWLIAAELLVFLTGAGNIDRSAGSVVLAVLAFAVHRALAMSGPVWLRRAQPGVVADRPDALARLLAAMLASAALATPFTWWWLQPLLRGGEAAMARSLLALQLLLGDFIGMLLIVPLALMLVRWRPTRAMRRAWRMDVPLVLVPALAIYAAVATRPVGQMYFFATVLCLLPVIHFAFRSGWRGVSIALPATSVTAALCSPEVDGGSAAQAQLLLALTGSACLLLGASMDALRAGRDEARERNMRLLAANRRLDAATARLRDAARRNLELSESTRRWVTSELHDELGQRITALQVRLKMVERRVGADDAFVPIRDIVDGMRRSVSRLMADLRPAGLEHFGLVQSLDRGPVRELLDAAGIAFALRIEDRHGLLDRLDDALQVALYRIVQEAATNTVRHANARTFRACLRARPNGQGQTSVLLAIGDDGIGLTSTARHGVGLQGMRDRVLSLGGRLRIGTGAGLRIAARIDAGGVDMGMVVRSAT